MRTKGHHSHDVPAIDLQDDLGNNHYWTRNAASVKLKKSNAQICYFAKNTPCNCTNVVLCRHWVLRQHTYTCNDIRTCFQTFSFFSNPLFSISCWLLLHDNILQYMFRQLLFLPPKPWTLRFRNGVRWESPLSIMMNLSTSSCCWLLRIVMPWPNSMRSRVPTG